MDPLKISALADVEDWDTFKPDMKGFIPQEMDLWLSDCDDLQEQLRYFASSQFMRDNDAPFLASSVSGVFPTTRLTICEEIFTVPVSSRDMTFLATHLGNSTASRRTVPATKVSILSDPATSLLSSTNRSVLDKLKAFEGNGGHEIMLVGLDVLKAGSHCLQPTATDENHYATILLVLPTFTHSVDISVRATHDSVVSQVKLPENLSETACAVGMYASVSDAHVQVGPGGEVICLTYHASVDSGNSPIPTLQGALPPVRDVFCLWRHMLNCGGGGKTPQLTLLFLAGHPKSAKDFNGEDATLLCHLAPLAKAYGFKMYITQLHRVLSTTQEVEHPYKEYDFDPSVLEMPDDADVEYEWKELYSLSGAPMKPQGLLELADKLVKTDEYLKDRLSDVDVEEDHDFLDDTCYYSTVQYTHTQKVSVLLIAP